MQTLISKKELLQLTKISYGQLYRWKRMNIIPEDWFIKKSTITGQETFFEKDKMLERIEFILSKKDELSLEEIAERLNKKAVTYSMPTASNKKISEKAKEVFHSFYEVDTNITSREIFIMAIIEQYLLPSFITIEELKIVIDVVSKVTDAELGKQGEVVICRKFGVPFVAYIGEASHFYIEDSANIVVSVNFCEEVEKMKHNFQ